MFSFKNTGKSVFSGKIVLKKFLFFFSNYPIWKHDPLWLLFCFGLGFLFGVGFFVVVWFLLDSFLLFNLASFVLVWGFFFLRGNWRHERKEEENKRKREALHILINLYLELELPNLATPS